MYNISGDEHTFTLTNFLHALWGPLVNKIANTWGWAIHTHKMEQLGVMVAHGWIETRKKVKGEKITLVECTL